MKKILFLVVAVLALGFNADAQKKLGYLNSQELLSAMPEYKQVSDSFEAYMTQLESDMKFFADEYQNKIADYQKNEKTWSQTIKEQKGKEIMELEKKIQEFQETSQVKAQEKQAALVKPLLDKIQKAIDAVGKENNFDYIYNETALLYAKDSENITPLVKAKLGIK